MPDPLQNSIKEYKSKLFNGKIGKYKKSKVEQCIDSCFTLFAQAEGRFSFALCKKIAKDIGNKKQNDIFEDVTNVPTLCLTLPSLHSKMAKTFCMSKCKMLKTDLH